MFPQLFRVLLNFHECFYNSIGTRRTCFLFLLENTATKKNKNNLFTSTIKIQILFVRAIITSTARASFVFLRSYRNTVLNQSACVFALGYFLNGNTVNPLIRTRSFQTHHRIIFLGFALQSFAISYFELPLVQTILLKCSIRSSEQDPIRAVFIFCKH